MKVWFTADHHFGHGNIIKFCNRPFASIDAMDEEFVSRWNEVVGYEDEVWHLGDFAYRCHPHRMAGLFDRLHGPTKHLITGYHDGRRTLQLPWTSARPYAEIMIGENPVVLFHYALKDWSRSRHGAWKLHGHGHGRMQPEGRSCDVGVDAWEYRPISFREIVASRLTAGLQPERPLTAQLAKRGSSVVIDDSRGGRADVGRRRPQRELRPEIPGSAELDPRLL